MKLTKIKYSSAAFFGFAVTIFVSIIGALLLVGRRFAYKTDISFAEFFADFGYAYDASWGYVLIQAPIIAGFTAYMTVLIALLIYNTVAKRYPIAWEVKK